MPLKVRAVEIETNLDNDIAKIYETLVSLTTLSQNPALAGAPQIKDATVLQARAISQQLKRHQGCEQERK